jgi:hypothetical protein
MRQGRVRLERGVLRVGRDDGERSLLAAYSTVTVDPSASPVSEARSVETAIEDARGRSASR